MKLELAIQLFERALTQEIGVVITTNNPHQMSLRLHKIRNHDPRFAAIEIAIPSTPETVMLVKKTVELDEDIGDLE